MSAVLPPQEQTASARVAVAIFAAFAFAYFFSALLRAVTATLAPAFSAELDLSAADLGLLAGAYFLGFSLMQLPLGRALDRYGSRPVLMAFLGLAVLACAGFALARDFATLLVARALIGVGVSACLMAPLTTYRHRFGSAAQLRANSWMLMTGSLGMLASTLPVQWLLPLVGWRGLFCVIAGLLALSIVLIGVVVPRDAPTAPATDVAMPGYGQIFRHPYFIRLAPLAFVLYGGLVAVQSLWAGPWLTDVGGSSAAEAAQGLFAINLSMLFAFLGWGIAMPHLMHRGCEVDRLIALGVPLALALLFGIVWLGPHAGPGWWALWCVSCTFVSLSQPAVALAFPAAAAGRALSAFNLVIFAGVFIVQWGIGLAIDALLGQGWQRVSAFQAAFALFALGCTLAYAWFLWCGRASSARGVG